MGREIINNLIYFLYSNDGTYVLSFLFLFLFFYLVLNISGTFESRDHKTNIILRKVKGLLSLTLSIITLYNPTSRIFIFNIINGMTTIILVFFALIIILYMAMKVVIKKEIVEDERYTETLTKLQKRVLYVFLALAIIGGIYLLSPIAYFNNILTSITSYIPKITIGGIILGILYIVILKPILREHKNIESKKSLKRVNEFMSHMSDLESKKENKDIERILKVIDNDENLSPEVKAAIASQILKEKRK